MHCAVSGDLRLTKHCEKFGLLGDAKVLQMRTALGADGQLPTCPRLSMGCPVSCQGLGTQAGFGSRGCCENLAERPWR